MALTDYMSSGDPAAGTDHGHFLPTSVARHMLARMQAAHQRRRIAVFSGPPGIGKTTAIEEFRKRRPREVAVVKVGRRNAKEVLVLQHMLEALRQLSEIKSLSIPSTPWELRQYLARAICAWADIDPQALRRGDAVFDVPRHLSVVFDEAQNLSRDAIEVLRYWNDDDRCYSPFPLGLIFVGNSEFSLAAGAGGSSTISAAVADRAYHIQALEYDDVADDDIALFMRAHGISDAVVRAQILRQLRAQRGPRSFRRVADMVEELKDVAGDAPVTSETVRQLLQAI